MPGVCSIKTCHAFKHIKVQEVVLNKNPLRAVVIAKWKKANTHHNWYTCVHLHCGCVLCGCVSCVGVSCVGVSCVGVSCVGVSCVGVSCVVASQHSHHMHRQCDIINRTFP